MIDENIIILKNVYGKTPGQSYWITPCRDPRTRQFPPCVRKVDINGEMILSESDKEKLSNPDQKTVFIPENQLIEIKDGHQFDLSDPLQKATWEAIKHSPFIADNRNQRDAKGNLVIDGEKTRLSVKTGPYGANTYEFVSKSGRADLYVYHPELVAKEQQNRRHLIFEAQTYVHNDSQDGRVRMCKLLEKDMSRSHPADVEAYLWDQATQYPEKIIELYTGTSAHLRLLIITAMEKKIIIKRDGLLTYADNIVLGASMDAAVTYLSQIQNKKVLDLIKQETYPEMFDTTANEKPAPSKTTAKK